LAHHREQDGDGEERESQAASSHNAILQGYLLVVLGPIPWLENAYLIPHDVVAAIYVNYFSGDSGTGVGGEKNSS
jgi:hypothetical protein